ncbi:bifunctional diaminohydroxyphosphoribosylaminopyrimidine deaminase/5-amino-6-(5-phosphoribosylamino)uracil reductase RibD [Zafaria sp. J156]|uniref:bifunctional diaminohydroxyphosphoribosylaminopyrimidine deaminase/5-amino-6-(5-phosphoribosylamino)uracil reductase RibD n=1 Tax=Zafaria sp. J156 TaxID=3116490 RepID=UPI002E766D4C|nr:bifunctional diaminohydroxyphosphoribosylaminopyrimidine deaminase/5-amino-6-(5-phosphoribosylamino)uracil reductase RibD [Zafaria sp. J156]MEE1620144.1 bifunctional diaminohydroxyphosphoribosylaminopyrimidine deaminase/5-amino-6-(5-phosphoribosylamino)uracil reductase RibD [Zafaria sp. J156]
MSAAAGAAVPASAFQLALDEAARGVRGANPLVGAVVLDGAGTVLATGHHRGAGTPHAEADALTRLGRLGPAAAAEATMLVTLEPCNHTGRTGPCSTAIAESGIGRVVYAVADPTAEAAGGAAALRARGIEAVDGARLDPAWAAAARELNRRWFAARREGRPFTSLHLAQTLDGRIAAADGSSQWITGSASRAHSHALRGRVDAIVAGTGTVLADDPRLTARTPDGRDAEHQPLRVVMGRRPVPARAAVRGDGHWLQLATHDPREVLAELGSRGHGHVLIEGGAAIATAFLAAGLVDEVWAYQAPLLLGAGRGAVGPLGVDTLDAALRFLPDDAGGAAVQRLGTDVVLHLLPAPAGNHTTTTTPEPRAQGAVDAG